MKIYYDGECPFCTKYVSVLRLREAAGPVELVDMRNDPVSCARWEAEGLEVDKGMIVETPSRVLHGADAMHALSMMSTGSGALNLAAATVFRHRILAMVLYPLLRAGRNATLFVLGRNSIRLSEPGEKALFEIFSRFLGLFAIFHALGYYFRYAPFDLKPTSIALLGLGVALIFNPASKRLFVLIILTFAVDGWLQAPIYSNHTILKNFLVLAVVCAGLWHILRGSSWNHFFRDFRPIGQTLLIIMYAFGVFHKINTDFLNPETSCAVALWRKMPPPLVWIDNAVMHYLAIYGTFIVEGAIMLMLIFPRWRHWGICLGLGFHSMLALSGYAMYPAFSTLSIVLHILFLPPSSALQIRRSNAYGYFDARLKSPVGLFFFLIAIMFIAYFALLRDYNMVAFIWLLLVAWLMSIVAYKGSTPLKRGDKNHYFWSPLIPLNVITFLFFANASAPYLGLKTAQTMNMFANLRVEGGVSNHLVISNAPRPFSYLQDLVVVTEAIGSPRLEQIAQRHDYALVYYHFISILTTEAPDAQVSYIRGEIDHPLTSVDDILAVGAEILHPDWARKFFHFRPVDLALPLRCEYG